MLAAAGSSGLSAVDCSAAEGRRGRNPEDSWETVTLSRPYRWQVSRSSFQQEVCGRALGYGWWMGRDASSRVQKVACSLELSYIHSPAIQPHQMQVPREGARTRASRLFGPGLLE